MSIESVTGTFCSSHEKQAPKIGRALRFGANVSLFGAVANFFMNDEQKQKVENVLGKAVLSTCFPYIVSKAINKEAAYFNKYK